MAHLKWLIVPMLWCGQGILTGDVKLIKTNIMEKHIDTAQIVSSNIDFLSVEAIADGISAQYFFCFQKKNPWPNFQYD